MAEAAVEDMAGSNTPDQQQSIEQAAEKSTGSKRKKGLMVLCILVVVAAWLGMRMFIASKTHIETDNAFIEARIVPVSSKVSGTVTRVLVNDNQPVKQGDLLVEIDPRDYQVQMAKAAAGVGVAENETGGEYLKAEAARAALQSARARHEQAILDQERGEKLFAREVISKEQLDRLKTARLVTESQQKEAEETLNRARTEAGLAGKKGAQAKVLERKA